METPIDTGRVDRQIYVIGMDAQKKLMSTTFLVAGLSGLGVEVAKNIMLGGASAVTLLDASPVTWSDLSTNFFAQPADVGKPRAEVVAPRIAELNPGVRVEVAPSGARLDDRAFLAKFGVAIICDHPTTLLTGVGEVARLTGTKLVCAEARGVAGLLFVDAGESHTVSDRDGEELPLLVVTAVMPATDGRLAFLVSEEERHGLSKDEKAVFKFSGFDGTLGDAVNDRELTATALDARTLLVEVAGGAEYTRLGYAKQVKQPLSLSFRTLKGALDQPVFFDTDEMRPARKHNSHLFFLALHRFMEATGGALPPPQDIAAAASIVKDARSQLATRYAKGFAPTGLDPSTAAPEAEALKGDGARDNELRVARSDDGQSVNVFRWDVVDARWKRLEAFGDFDEEHVTTLARTAAGQTVALTAFLGGFVAQEAMKLCTGKFCPVRQWMYFDAADCLPTPLPSSAECAPRSTRHDGHAAIFGWAAQEAIQQARVFLVGAGALGCEFLKNFALCGAGSSGNGQIVVTDPDGIEKTNLSRQFLFRSSHIGQLKSTIAGAAAGAMNPSLRISALTQRVGPETVDIFGDQFWDSMDVVTNALDNVAARLFVDSRCVYFNKPLLESGTLGTKANSQVILPGRSESYGSSSVRDPPEKSIPLCTLKNFPHLIEHTIQWARDMFEGYFTKLPEDMKQLVAAGTHAKWVEELKREPANMLQRVTAVLEGTAKRPRTFEDCVRLARLKLHEEFYLNISQLLHNFPPDHVTSKGERFWTGTKRPPHPIEFNPADSMHVDFLVGFTVCLADVYGISRPARIADINRAEVVAIASALPVPPFVPKRVKYATEESEAAQQQAGDTAADPATLALQVPAPDVLTREGFKVEPLAFEKDHDDNGHVLFVTAASNLRASAYNIGTESFERTKMIAGRIIPAMVTTTAMITGLVMFEFFKLRLGVTDISRFRNYFVNLALPLVSFSDPMPAPVRTYAPGKTFTLWDSFTVDKGRDITIGELVEHFKATEDLEISMLSAGSCILYSAFAPKPKVQERLRQPVAQCFQDLSGQKLPPSTSYFLIVMTCSVASSGEDVDEVPCIRYKYRF